MVATEELGDTTGKLDKQIRVEEQSYRQNNKSFIFISWSKRKGVANSPEGGILYKMRK